MKVKIEIDCSDTDEVLLHLSVIRQQLKKKFIKLEKDHPFTQWAPFTVTDSNCYGTHKCIVVDDTGPCLAIDKTTLKEKI